MARGKSSFSRSPLHTRFLDFVDKYNSENEKLCDKIRCSKLTTAKVLLFAYYNKNFSTEIRNWEGKNPAFLPALSFNNVETIERIGMEARSTAWRSISFLCKLDLGENKGVFMKKKFCGFCQDYLLHFNPFIVTGQIVENWGTPKQGAWISRITSRPHGVDKSKKLSKMSKFSPIETPTAIDKPSLVANCNPPIMARTDIDNINITTTKVCGKVENVLSDEQEQQTGTEVGSIALNPLLAKYLAQKGYHITQTGGAAQNVSETNGNQRRAKFYGKSSVENQKNVSVSSPATGINDYQTELVNHSRSLTIEFLKYSMPLLYPNFKFHSKKQQSELLRLIWISWFGDYVNHPKCTTTFLDKHLENLKEAVITSLQEVASRNGAYISANPMKFFDKNFPHGLKRATEQWTQRHLNKDKAILLKAKRSISSGKMPKAIKNLSSMMDLVAYWRQHIERVCYQPQLISTALNQFLMNPQNLAKNGTKF